MVQEQLVEYIRSQLKAGVSKEALKSTLVGAGWMAADVDDTMKKVEGEAKPAAPAGASAGPASAVAISSSAAKPVSAQPVIISSQAGSMGSSMSSAGRPGERTIRISDLVSSGTSGSGSVMASGAGAGSGAGGGAAGGASAGTASGKKNFFGSTPSSTASSGSPASPAMRGGRMGIVILAVIALACAGAAGYFYFENMGLSGKVSSLGSTSANVSAQISSLTSEVQSLDASNTALAANVGVLQAKNDDLENNISFVAAPVGSPVNPPAENTSVAGTLEKRSTSFILTTSHGVNVYVKNSTDALVKAALTPLLASTSSVTLGGSHLAGSPYLTVISVNGAALGAATATSTATSTASTTAP